MSEPGRLHNKVCVIVGAGQTPGETIGNGRATAIRFAQEGARLLLADNRPDSAADTAQLIAETVGAEAIAEVCEVDVTDEASCQALIDRAHERFGVIDVLHYNVGKSEGDREVSALPATDWNAIMDLNLRGFYFCCKYVLPVFRAQRSGVITGISSAAAVASGRNMTYKVSKAGMNALVQSMALDNASHGIRVNAIMPGLMDTPMAIERRAREQGRPRAEVRALRDAQVPLSGRMGTAWDVANAALFLASDEAAFITGIALPVDGGSTARIG